MAQAGKLCVSIVEFRICLSIKDGHVLRLPGCAELHVFQVLVGGEKTEQTSHASVTGCKP